MASPNQPPNRIDPRLLHLREVVERPEAERPVADTIENILEWLAGPAQRIDSASRAFDEFAWRLLAAGLPVLRVTLHAGTLHPQYLGATYTWWRTEARTTVVMVSHELHDLIPYDENPVLRVREGGETLRRPLEGENPTLDFTVLRELRAVGATDYLALPAPSAFGGHYVVTFVSDRPGGFGADEVAILTRAAQRLALLANMHSQRFIASNLLAAYLGPKTGPRVLAGEIRRGTGEEIGAVIWSSDLRGFTERSDRLSGARVIAILNALFDAQAQAIAAHGGEVLKFIGDGLLAIFPIEDAGFAGIAARNALEAARETQTAVAALSSHQAMDGESPLKIVVALHVGHVIYGNIGAAERLDFTVIGPAVNLVSRIEAIAKAQNLPIVVSDDFAGSYGGPLVSLGRHQLRGLSQPHELFRPA
ncbi:MAG TPA: adenylate/guanylate cyclase domain-containing protein [Stellaceae bacterium]|nr:adenylate/guanylate cyclase domain-containing protein [Stellaceae bacterium]